VELYGIILSKHETVHKADIRKIAIPLKNHITNIKMYSPTAPAHIMPAFYDMVKFLNIDNHIDILIKAALAHYQFEMIHPFEKHNGLLGRIIIQMIFKTAGFKAASFMCISEYLETNKEVYFDKLSATQRGSGFILWIKFFVQGICISADQAIIRIRRFTETISKDETIIASLTLPSKYTDPVYDYFKRHLISEIMPVSDQLGISYNTAAKVVKLLVKAKVLSLEQKQSRRKVYHHRALEYLD
jgi:Fic family protein